jgi:hypothetical protein
MIIALAPAILIAIIAAIAVAIAALSAAAGPGGACAEVKATPEILNAKFSEIVAWAKRWEPKKDVSGSGPDAVLDFVRTIYPQCKWSASSTTRIIRVDGSSVVFSDMIALVQGKTVAEADAILQGMEGSAGGAPAMLNFRALLERAPYGGST